jgi:hypothetical protein
LPEYFEFIQVVNVLKIPPLSFFAAIIIVTLGYSESEYIFL